MWVSVQIFLFFPKAHVSVSLEPLPAPQDYTQCLLVCGTVVDAWCEQSNWRWMFEVLGLLGVLRHIWPGCAAFTQQICLVSSLCYLNIPSWYLKDSLAPESPGILNFGMFESSWYHWKNLCLPLSSSEGCYISWGKHPSLVFPAHRQGGFTLPCYDKTETCPGWTGIPEVKYTCEKTKREGIFSAWSQLVMKKILQRIEKN